MTVDQLSLVENVDSHIRVPSDNEELGRLSEDGGRVAVAALLSLDLRKRASRDLFLRHVFSLPLTGELPRGVVYFLALRFALFIFLLVLGAAVLSPERWRQFWFVPPMGFAGVMIPASGLPVGGGILFFPVLRLAGVSAKDAVVFGVGAQSAGGGVFTPASWWLRDKGVFLRPVFPYALVSGVLGLVVARSFPSTNEAIQIIFVVFMGVVIVHTVRGLYQGKLESDDEEMPMQDRKFRAALVAASFAGGILVGYIGIGIDKLLFVLLTQYRVNSTKASVTSITMVGLLSIVSSLDHIVVRNDFPWELWLLVLPGLLLGSMIGPFVNKLVGPRRILIAFVVLLFADAIKIIVDLTA